MEHVEDDVLHEQSTHASEHRRSLPTCECRCGEVGCGPACPYKLPTSMDMTPAMDKGTVESAGDLDPVVLPEEMLEKIISSIPYPFVFKACTLSHDWYSKFFSNGPSSFKEQVSESSKIWPSYCPVLIHGNELTGFDRSAKQWKQISIHSSVPGFYPYLTAIAFGGSILCVVEISSHCGLVISNQGYGSLNLLIANTSTGIWRRVPCPCRNVKCYPLNVHVLRDGSDYYKILLVYYRYTMSSRILYTQIFDSRSHLWKERSWESPDQFGAPRLQLQGTVCLNGTLFLLCTKTIRFAPDGRGSFLLRLYEYTLDDEERASVIFAHFHTTLPLEKAEDVLSASVVLCGSRLVIVVVPVLDTGAVGFSSVVRVYELKILHNCKKLVELSRSPPSISPKLWNTHVVSDGNWIYFCHGDQSVTVPDDATIFAFDLLENTWSVLPHLPSKIHKWEYWMNSPFTPGLRPLTPP